MAQQEPLIVELASGIDALYLSGRAVVPEEWLSELELQKASAVESGQGRPVVVGGVEVALQPHGFGRYRYCLSHRHGLIGITPSKNLPAIRVQPRSEFLHGVGPGEAAKWFDRVLAAAVGAIRWSVSRLDVFSDWQGWALAGDDRHRFLCRSSSVVTRERDGELTGMEFGRRTTKTVCARIYDKTAEIAESGAAYWEEIWGAGRALGAPVLRVEFEIGREGLREFGVVSPEEALADAGALWAYATGSWLTYRSPTGDGTRSRWPLDPAWQRIQRSMVADGAFGVERMYRGSQMGGLQRLTPGLVGYLAGFGAHVGTIGITDTCAELARYLKHTERSSPYTFAYRLDEKRRKLPW